MSWVRSFVMTYEDIKDIQISFALLASCMPSNGSFWDWSVLNPSDFVELWSPQVRGFWDLFSSWSPQPVLRLPVGDMGGAFKFSTSCLEWWEPLLAALSSMYSSNSDPSLRGLSLLWSPDPRDSETYRCKLRLLRKGTLSSKWLILELSEKRRKTITIIIHTKHMVKMLMGN